MESELPADDSQIPHSDATIAYQGRPGEALVPVGPEFDQPHDDDAGKAQCSPLLIEDSPMKPEQGQPVVDPMSRVADMVSCREDIEEKISELTAKLNEAKKCQASRILCFNS